ncbi:MAG: hypothetical protein J6B75_05975 [Ruminococcus sp.]|nr:hypothetical protein [Ruminococcus sp.]
MKDTEFTVRAIADMYESLFYYFLGDNDSLLTKEACIRYPLSMYHKNNPQICPAKYLVVNALIKAVSPQQEELSKVNKEEWQKRKKKVSAYLLKTKLIDFEKLDDIYAKVRDRRLNPQQRVQVKEEILGIMDPQYLIAVHLYMKYHKIFDRELFDAFCGMVITSDRCSRSEEIPSYSFAALTVGEELVSEVMKCIFTTNGKGIKTPIMLYEEVYADFLSVEREYPAFKAYEPTMKQFETHIVEVLNIAETEWNPENTKKNKAREFPKSIVNQYLKFFSKLVRKKVIVKLKTTSKQDPSKPNQRTMRSKINEIAKKFDLQVCKNNYPIDIKSCPDFLIDELWECLKKYGLKGHDSEKLEPDVYSIIDEKRAELMGRLYIIVLLCYAFDKGNYQESSLSFMAILNISVAKKNKTVRAMLRAYCELTDNADDQAIITELL